MEHSNEHVMSEVSRLYQRELPGGGYVAIELVCDTAHTSPLIEQPLERRSEMDRRHGHVPPALALPQGRPLKGRVSVERRAPADRRGGPEIPVIAEVEREDVGSVFNELYQIACDNVAVARGILHWQASQRGDLHA